MTIDTGEGLDVTAVSLLRSAAEELLPVIVDLGPDQARFATLH